MIELENKTSLAIDMTIPKRIAASLTKKDIELIVVDSFEMKEINKAYRNIDKDTDVLSFPLENMPKSPLGTIIISSLHVEQKALELCHSQDSEFTLLFIHGLLHLLGYDHECDQGEMREKEAELIKKFNLPQSLIERNS